MDVYESLLNESHRLLSGQLSEEHAGVGKTKARVSLAQGKMTGLKQLTEVFKKEVEEGLRLEKELEAASERYVLLADKVGFVIDEVEEAIAEPILGNSVEEVEELGERFEKVTEEFKRLNEVMVELSQVSEFLTRHERAERMEEERQATPPAVLLATYRRVEGGIEEHTAALARAREETWRKVRAREGFAAAARGLNGWVQQLTEMSKLGGRRSSLQPEEVKKELEALREEYERGGREGGRMVVVEAASEEQEAVGVVANGFVTDTVYSLRKEYEELGKLLEARLNDCLTAQAMLKTQTAESDEQMKEVTMVFQALTTAATVVGVGEGEQGGREGGRDEVGGVWVVCVYGVDGGLVERRHFGGF